jgi:putative transposase
MPGRSPQSIEVSDRHRPLLECLARRQTGRHGPVARARVVLACSDPTARNEGIARRLGLKASTVAKWRSRWPPLARHLKGLEATLRLGEKTEAQIDRALQRAVEAGLSDAPRSGAPPTFTPEQLAAILAVACEDPQKCGRPVSHWTPRELTDEVQKRQIVPRISVRSVGRFLKRSRFEASPEPLLAQP